MRARLFPVGHFPRADVCFDAEIPGKGLFRGASYEAPDVCTDGTSLPDPSAHKRDRGWQLAGLDHPLHGPFGPPYQFGDVVAFKNRIRRERRECGKDCRDVVPAMSLRGHGGLLGASPRRGKGPSTVDFMQRRTVARALRVLFLNIHTSWSQGPKDFGVTAPSFFAKSNDIRKATVASLRSGTVLGFAPAIASSGGKVFKGLLMATETASVFSS